MNRLLQTAIYLIMSIWLGSLLGVFLCVTSLFKSPYLKKEGAGLLASGMFREFNHVRLILAAVGVLLTFIWWMTGRSKLRVALFMIFAGAIAAAVVTAGILTPRIERLRNLGEAHSADFNRLHGLSMGFYLLEACLVFIGCALLPWAPRDERAVENRTSNVGS